MVYGIRIDDEEFEGVPICSLSEMLALLEGQALHWAILDIDGAGDFGEGQSMLQFEQSIDETPNGYHLVWGELTVLAKKYNQVWWLTLIGCQRSEQLTRFDRDEDMIQMCNLVIEMINSSYTGHHMKCPRPLASLQAFARGEKQE